MKKERKRRIMAVGGILISGASVGIFQKIALGTDPFTCFVTGIANICHSTYSTWFMILTAVILVGVAVFQRHYIGFATLMSLFLTGAAADAMHACMDVLLPETCHSARASCCWPSMFSS